MDLGNFSVSLAVKDLTISRAFYENLGFTAVAGDAAQGWLVLKNQYARIGLFRGMFEKNILTFNPGWDASAQPLDGAPDIRTIQADLLAKGIVLDRAAEAAGSGPDYLQLTDPDGNAIMLDQHL